VHWCLILQRCCLWLEWLTEGFLRDDVGLGESGPPRCPFVKKGTLLGFSASLPAYQPNAKPSLRLLVMIRIWSFWNAIFFLHTHTHISTLIFDWTTFLFDQYILIACWWFSLFIVSSSSIVARCAGYQRYRAMVAALDTWAIEFLYLSCAHGACHSVAVFPATSMYSWGSYHWYWPSS